MQDVYLIIRVEANRPKTKTEAGEPGKAAAPVVSLDSSNPVVTLHDVTKGSLPSRLRVKNHGSSVDIRHITNPSTSRTYSVACEKKPNPEETWSIPASFTSAEEALAHLGNIPEWAKESCRDRDIALKKEPYKQKLSKWKISWEGERCVKIKHNEDSITWYLLETIICEEPRSKEMKEQDKADLGGMGTRSKSKKAAKTVKEQEGYEDAIMEDLGI
ncbi:hypothetical protein PtrSN002B_003469 [Pyrenophora tritici-repentis]|nr:uncharacterized protein PTRG_09385 [Pyrenophora tritici-repentis Pt-1C-BFP]KAI1512228.1 hypothetical protein Ptr86124_009068 [Pyrenophora tritici-repentis]EDU42436.1 predicted protein [Pyrenophora tritici-repentis Pt-1C-BFP]KAI1545194.1 hypothetical protein PtrSN001C_003275 [Pyrenophora tritici-repentis]KAI1554968.1 hypothetical protein PtrSN002B_003469 [Pyrenophora tritici-repentis]KAI1573733.1 hypothetical protein PtrEW4_003565 [Pyrenophora tritici-repentis]